MSGAVAWFTGLPASGKSTLARDVRQALRERGRVDCVLLDGDEVRAALVPAPGYDEAGRAAFYETLARLAARLAGQRLLVLVAATANRRQFRARARALAPRFVEVHVRTSVEECRRRDPKGLYRAATGGAVTSLPGADADYEAPLRPEIVAEGGEDQEAVRRVVDALCEEA